MLTPFLNFVDRANEWVGRIVSIWMLPLILLMSFEVFMRYILQAPTEWGTEMVTFIYAAYVLLGGGYTLLYGDHVNINVIYNRLSTRRKAFFDVITGTVFFLYSWILFWEGSKFAWDAIIRNRHTGTDWNPPFYPILITLPIGAFLILIQGAAKFIRDLNTAVTGKERAK
jgi:TRAP-type mannitol/chloroaromatic compound transport system permease small subunit